MANDDRAQQQAEIREQFSGPVPASTRQINADTHLGSALQRPYATAEDQLVALRGGGFGSFEELKAALAGRKGTGNDIEQGPDGLWFRLVPVVEERELDDRGRTVAVMMRDAKRYVALSRADAKRMTETGLEADAFEAGTWWRRGQKPERDFAVSNDQDGRTALRRVELDERGQPKDDGARRRVAVAPEPSRPAGDKKGDG